VARHKRMADGYKESSLAALEGSVEDLLALVMPPEGGGEDRSRPSYLKLRYFTGDFS